MDRARQLGEGIAKLPPLRRIVEESVGSGLALEGISATAITPK
jgi:hypothetical protein